jgi:hypothetical protein
MSYPYGGDGLYDGVPFYEPYQGTYDDPGPYGYAEPYEANSPYGETGTYGAFGSDGESDPIGGEPFSGGSVSPAAYPAPGNFGGSPYGAVSPGAGSYGSPGAYGYPGPNPYGYPGAGPSGVSGGYGGFNRSGWIVLLIVLLVIGGYWLYRSGRFFR